MDRLRLTKERIEGMAQGIRDVVALPDPVGRVLRTTERPGGLLIKKVSVPMGVIAIIYESRPNVTSDAAALCLKSGNCALLKGGSETLRTNKALFEVIHAAAVDAGLPSTCLHQVEAREEIGQLLECDESVDLLIPRGSNAFVRYIMDHTRIPVMGHADGICHIYVDEDANIEKAVRIVVDAKVQYTAACNAVETLLVHRSIAQRALPAIVAGLEAEGVEVRGTEEVRAIVECAPATDEDWDTEYLALTISIKLVDNVDEAIEHINRHGSHHTDAIVTENPATAERFMQLVDSAGVYQNASTRFADGFRYGFGAEVGISTSKLHARGPVGLEGLVTYKYKIYGTDHIVGDYASGVRSFHFKDLA